MTLLIKVKDHRGDPLNEETDIRAITQYASIKSALERTLHHQGWTVSQKSFIAGTRSRNEKDLHDNPAFLLQGPGSGYRIHWIKISLKNICEYANILKGMYGTRFNGCPKNKDDHDQMDTAPDGPSPPLCLTAK